MGKKVSIYDSEFSYENWKAAVAAGDTRLGYDAWRYQAAKQVGELPVIERHGRRADRIRMILDFLEWLAQEKSISLHQHSPEVMTFERFMPVYGNREHLVLDYFEIDPKQLEAERQALLEHVRQNPPPVTVIDGRATPEDS